MFRNLGEIWRFRTLAWALVCRHLSARYRGSVLGFLWSFLNPLCLIGIYALVFKYYIRFSQVDNYTLFLFAGLLPWIWFSSGLIESTASISSGGSLITKAMFPSHVLPTVSVMTNLMNFLFAVPLLFIYMLVLGVHPGWGALLFPVIVFLEFIFLWGLALGLSAINVYFRDVQHIMGNVVSLWFFLCPIIYPAENVPSKFAFTLWVNPIALFTQMYHITLLQNSVPSWEMFVFSGGVAGIVFILGNWIFNYYREGFAELI